MFYFLLLVFQVTDTLVQLGEVGWEGNQVNKGVEELGGGWGRQPPGVHCRVPEQTQMGPSGQVLQGRFRLVQVKHLLNKRDNAPTTKTNLVINYLYYRTNVWNNEKLMFSFLGIAKLCQIL